MDIQSQVAARRAELARQAEEAQRHERQAAEEAARRERRQRTEALDGLAAELSTAGTQVVREREQLAIAEEPLAALDGEDFKRSALEGLLSREARQRWTSGQNWAVIASITAGVLTVIPMFPVGILLLIIGFGYADSLKRRYRTVLIGEFPQLFAGLGARPEKDIVGGVLGWFRTQWK